MFIIFICAHFVHRVDGISYSSIEVRSLVSAEASRREGFDARNVFRPCFRENLTKIITIQKLAYENFSLDKIYSIKPLYSVAIRLTCKHAQHLRQ